MHTHKITDKKGENAISISSDYFIRAMLNFLGKKTLLRKFYAIGSAKTARFFRLKIVFGFEGIPAK